MIILELGSGNSCRNDEAVVRDMIDAVADTGIYATLKFQLFTEDSVYAKANRPLDRGVFEFAHDYGSEVGYPVTASVFDAGSLAYLLNFDVPFVKIACVPELYPLARTAHAFGVRTVVSYPSITEMGKNSMVTPLCAVRKYPARIEDYENQFSPKWLQQGISDHTEGFELYHKYKPEWWEKHVVLERDDSNPDAGPFAVTIDELMEIL